MIKYDTNTTNVFLFICFCLFLQMFGLIKNFLGNVFRWPPGIQDGGDAKLFVLSGN